MNNIRIYFIVNYSISLHMFFHSLFHFFETLDQRRREVYLWLHERLHSILHRWWVSVPSRYLHEQHSLHMWAHQRKVKLQIKTHTIHRIYFGRKLRVTWFQTISKKLSSSLWRQWLSSIVIWLAWEEGC